MESTKIESHDLIFPLFLYTESLWSRLVLNLAPCQIAPSYWKHYQPGQWCWVQDLIRGENRRYLDGVVWVYHYTEYLWWEVNIGPGKWLGACEQPLPEPLLAKIYVVISYTRPQLRNFHSRGCCQFPNVMFICFLLDQNECETLIKIRHCRQNCKLRRKKWTGVRDEDPTEWTEQSQVQLPDVHWSLPCLLST